MGFDWRQIWEVSSSPDNVPIVGLLFLIPFYVWYAIKQGLENDKLIAILEGDAQAAKTKYRKTQPWDPSWDREVHTWPFLMRMEFLVAIILTILLMVWSLTLNAPLEEPSNPNVTMNPAKAPWYFLGLQEMLVYFDPWMAGVVMPTLIIVGLMVVPYIDVNPLGNGYYTYKQRKFAIWTFLFGFIGLWILMIVIGTFIRGPGWMWFWPGQTWDAERVDYAVNRNLDQVAGINGSWLAAVTHMPTDQAAIWARAVFGIFPTVLFFIVAGFLVHWICMRTEFARKMYKRMSLVQLVMLYTFLILMLSLPIKILLRLVFTIKYVWVTPWFSI
jgi:Cytochrome b(C-terminal)/b6/petD